ncbi:hypothetical protein [Phycicoccus duodecadis]|uniref:Uncharacterized protein n=1 Tax=Phycicoccus duodecadis TaxID=173053 RepID=A0A2N3YG88_9MICO|nr:hypothetical protein [Phycicoccus duodecadis]PKW25858.1 hypothetical protein ATL31_0660 [Phycicoccus duodecadis]
MPEDERFDAAEDRGDQPRRVHINGSTVGRRPDAEPVGRPGSDGDRPAGYTDIPEWVSEFRRLYVEPKTRPDRPDRLGWPRRTPGSTRPEVVAGASATPHLAAPSDGAGTAEPLAAPGLADGPTADAAPLTRTTADATSAPLADRARRSEEPAPAEAGGGPGDAGLGWPEAASPDEHSGAPTGAPVATPPPPAEPAGPAGPAGPAPEAASTGSAEPERPAEEPPVTPTAAADSSEEAGPAVDRHEGSDATAEASRPSAHDELTASRLDPPDEGHTGGAPLPDQLAADEATSPGALDPVRRGGRHGGSSGVRRLPKPARAAAGERSGGGSDDGTGRESRAGARRAARLAERRGRQRRLLALAAAVLLVVVVATTWWVTRGNPSASAGTLDAQLSRLALTAAPAAPVGGV